MRQGFMRHERLSLYNSLINDEVRKHIKIWCGKDKVDLFKSVSQLVTSINIRCVLGDDAYYAHAEEIASIYYQLELSGTTSHCVFCACACVRVRDVRWVLTLTPTTTTAMDTVAILFPSLPTATKRANEKARKRLIEIISNVLHSRSEDQVRVQFFKMYIILLRYQTLTLYCYLLLFYFIYFLLACVVAAESNGKGNVGLHRNGVDGGEGEPQRPHLRHARPGGHVRCAHQHWYVPRTFLLALSCACVYTFSFSLPCAGCSWHNGLDTR
jgi:hypothetical protein